MIDSPRSFFGGSRLMLGVSLFLVLALGFAIRLYDLTDLPLDFHPTRQLFSAIKARGMYYQGLPEATEWQREKAVQMWKARVTIEPEVLPWLAARLYRPFGEQLWIPRLLSSLFWLAGGIFLFLLARRLTSVDGGLLALATYCFSPYGIFASRSFQPDPLMVLCILVFWWSIWRWAQKPQWRWALVAGFSGGAAIFVKFVAAFFVVGGGLGATLVRMRLRGLLRSSQTWCIVGLGALPGTVWLLYGLTAGGFLREEFGGNFILSLFTRPSYYLGWQNNINTVAGAAGVSLGLLGLFLVRDFGARVLLFSLWSTYLCFGLVFNYHISTHDYYSLPLIPIIALSVAPVGDRLFSWLDQETPKIWMRIAVALTLLYGAGAHLWNVRNEMKAVDYRAMEAFWLEIGRSLDRGSVVALTEDYGLSLAYWGWQNSTAWPPSGQLDYRAARGSLNDLDALFSERVQGKSFFLVTNLADFERQLELRQRLFAQYTLVSQDEGYLIFDLTRPSGGAP